MTTAALIEALDAAGFDVDPECVLDALWLCSLGRILSVGPVASIVPKPSPGPSGDDPNSDVSGLANAIQKERDFQPTEKEPFSDNFEGEAPVFGRGEVGAADKTLPATSILLPSARALPDRLPLIRALRPLRQPVPSSGAVELDEERTAELTAEIGGGNTGAIFPVLRPRYERCYEAHIVVENDLAIELWAAPAREFAQLLRDAGVFRLVRSWQLQLDKGARGNPVTAWLEAPTGGLFSAGMLGHAGQLIFFLSPGRSLRWVDGTFARLLESWSGASVTLLHLRPRDRWAHTLLGEPQGMASTLQPGGANRTFKVETFWWRSGPDPAQPHVVTLPAIPLEAAALGQWARMQMGLGRQAETFLLDAAETLTPEEAAALAPEAIDARRALAELRETSERAYDLAILLANAPFTLPVSRLVQEVAQNGSTDFSVLADLMLSGVVVPREGQLARTREDIYYTVSEAARPLLLRSLRSADVEMLVTSLENRISRHLGEIAGRAESFSALIAHPDGLERLPNWARPFAHFLTTLRDRGTGRTATRSWREDLASLDSATIGRLARLAELDIVLSHKIVTSTLWPAVDNPRFIRPSAEGELRFLPEVASQLRERLAASPYLGLIFLWVDDNPDNNAKIVAHLRNRGAYKITLALTTEEALADPELRTYDIILSDMSRGDDDAAGYKLLRKLREQGIATPVLFFAGYTIRSKSSRARAIAAGAFGATSDFKEALSLIDRAARAAVLRQEPPPAPALRDLDAIPEGSFCTLEEIYREVKQSPSVREAAIVDSLLFFQTGRQQSWLVVTREQIVLLLDDPKTRAAQRLVQKVANLSAATPVSAGIDGKGVATVGFGSIGNRWYYSPLLFARPGELEAAVRALVEMARLDTPQASLVPSALSAESRAAQSALRKIGIECSDEVALDIVVEAARLAPHSGYSDAVSLSRLFCGAITVGEALAPGFGPPLLMAFARVMRSPSEAGARRIMFSDFRRQDAGEAVTRLQKSGFSNNTRKALKQAADVGRSGSGLRSEQIVEALLNPIAPYQSSRLYGTISVEQLVRAVTEEAGPIIGGSAAIKSEPTPSASSELKRNFSREIRKALKYHAVLPPAASLRVGTIGVIENDVFRPVGDPTEVVELHDSDKTLSSVADVEFRSDQGVAIGMDAQVLTVSFSRRNAWLLHLSGCRSARIRDLSGLADMLAARLKKGSWQENWHVVTEAIEADRSTILMSGASTASVVLELGLEERQPGHQPAWSDTLQIRSSHGLAFSFITTSRLTSLFKLARVRRPFLRSEPRLEMVP